MDQVQVLSNLKYSGVDQTRLLMDVYVPNDLASTELRPVMILVHGGAGPDLRPKDWGVFQSWGRLIAAAGMVAVTFNHQLSPPPESLLAESNSTCETRSTMFARTQPLGMQTPTGSVSVCGPSEAP
jgi:hypothetical protein